MNKVLPFLLALLLTPAVGLAQSSGSYATSSAGTSQTRPAPDAIWETSYLQVLSSVEEGHPVRHFTQSTAMRPFASALSRQDFRKFLNAYDAALSEAYPLADDGSVSFQFQRLFIVLST